MAIINNYWHEPVLPWSETDSDKRFSKILRLSLIFAVICGIAIPFLPAPKPEKKQLEQISPRLAKLIIEKQKQAAVKPKIKPRIIKKKITPKPAAKTRSARAKAQQSGLLAMKSELLELQSAFDMSSFSDSTPLAKANTSRTTSTRSTINDIAHKDSGGINTQTLSNKTGGSGLASRRSASVSSNIGTKSAGNTRQSSTRTRAEEELALVFEKNKGAIFSLYNRALRKDPSLQGKVVLELTITANGKVIKCRIISSELNSPSLERKLIARIKLFRFAARQVKTITVTYPIDFLPS